MKSYLIIVVTLLSGCVHACEQIPVLNQFTHPTTYTNTLELCKQVCDIFDAFDATVESRGAWNAFEDELATSTGALARVVEQLLAEHGDGGVCSLDDLQHLMDIVYEISVHHKNVFAQRHGNKVGYTSVVLRTIRQQLYDVLQDEYEVFLQLKPL